MDTLIDYKNILNGLILTLLTSLIPLIIRKIRKSNDKGKRLVFLYFLIIITSFLVIRLFTFYNSHFVIKNNAETTINSNIWMTYDPSDFNPKIKKIPKRQSLEKDIKIIKELGFDGIITFNCNDYMKIIPELSRKNNLKIIIGIWDVKDSCEIARAISLRNYACGYCVGHNGIGYRYSEAQLKRTINILRSATAKPITTTEPIKEYISNRNLINYVDWIFPDVSFEILDSVNVNRDVRTLVEHVYDLNSISDNKPILLKMALYPYSGIKNASIQNQTQFYHDIIMLKKNSLSKMPRNSSISFYGLYDPYWKDDFLYPWEPYTGMVNSNGEPSQSLKEIMKMLKSNL